MQDSTTSSRHIPNRRSMSSRRSSRPGIALSLLAVLFGAIMGGLALRLYGLNWDQGQGVHPDERYISSVASSIRFPDDLRDMFNSRRSTLNPYFGGSRDKHGDDRDTLRQSAEPRSFAYGHLPLYLMVAASGGDTDEGRLTIVGRVISALCDTITIVLTFALGRLLWSSAVGLLAASFVALTVIHLQLSHFATFDTALTCLVLATLLFSVRFAKHGQRRDNIMMGICLGLAVGCKFSAFLLVFPLLISLILHWSKPSVNRAPSPKRHVVVMLFAGIVVFGLTNPFSLLQPSAFIAGLADQAAMLRGDPAIPFVIQYENTVPYLYPIVQQLVWGIGLPLGIVALVGTAVTFVLAWRGYLPKEFWIPLAWMAGYFGYIGSLHTKFIRYLLPVMPVIAIFGAFSLFRMLSSDPTPSTCKSAWSIGKRLRAGLAAFVVVFALLYALAFLNVYRGEHPWLKLSRWIYSRVSTGSTIATEAWDHQLPLTLVSGEGARWPGEYGQITLEMYGVEKPANLRLVLRGLADSDYLVVASNRLYGSIGRLPIRFPVARRYYELLFSGRLGFRAFAVPGIERHPRLGKIALVSDPFRGAGLPSPVGWDPAIPSTLPRFLGHPDESFTVYDHPRPIIFENDRKLSAVEMERLFADLVPPDA